MRAVLDQDDSLRAAISGDLLDVERDVTADVDEEDRMRLVRVRFALEVLERHAEVVAVAVDELDAAAGGLDGERGGHEGVRRAEHRPAAHLEVLECGECGAHPAPRRYGRQSVPRAPCLLELTRDWPFGPLLGVEGGVPQGMQPHAVAVVEADGEGIEVHEPAG